MKIKKATKSGNRIYIFIDRTCYEFTLSWQGIRQLPKWRGNQYEEYDLRSALDEIKDAWGGFPELPAKRK